MKDAFKNVLRVGDRVIYSVNNSYGTTYIVGVVVKIHSGKRAGEKTADLDAFPPAGGPFYRPPPPLDRVEVKPVRTSTDYKPAKNPIVYATNVVKIVGL